MHLIISQSNFLKLSVKHTDIAAVETFGSDALSDKMLPVSIVENNKIDADFRAV